MEIFKTITGFEKYQVSNFGNVRKAITGKIIKPEKIYSGYLRIQLSQEKSKPVKILVHRLVCSTFLGDFPNLTVHHKNHKRDDNRLENLEWLSMEENLKIKMTKKKFRKQIEDLYKGGKFDNVKDFYEAIMEL